MDKKPGSFIKGFRCENLESTTFEDESLDIVLTQDVLEHVLHPKRAFIDIARTLKPGGAHIFTVPIDGRPTSITRAKIENGILVHKHPPIYHNDEFNNDCSLVITDWGLDIIDTIRYASGLTTTHLLIRDTFVGIEGRHRNDIYNEVFVTRKPLSVY